METYEVVELSLDGKAPDIVGQLKDVMGFALLRRLARKYDPISPQLKQLNKSISNVIALLAMACSNLRPLTSS